MIPSQLEGFRQTLDAHRSRSPRLGRTIAIGSGKGGVGKSSFALNLAVAAALVGQRSLLVDADPGLADLNIFLGINPELHWGHFVRGERTLDEVVLRNVVSGMDFVHGFSGVTDPGWMQGDAARALCNAVETKRMEYDWTIYDVGAGLAEPNMAFLTGADQLLLVLSPELTSLADAYGTLKTVILRKRDQRVGVVVNGAESVEQARTVYLNLVKIAAQFLGIRVPLVGWVPKDPELPRSLMRQLPLVQSLPEGPYGQGVRKILQAIRA